MNDRHSNASGLCYRADIDGLRALAIVPVVLYHAGVSWFGGGFVGVDIFFVISGYLITLFITDRIYCGKFSIADFYLRRIRRILPALFVVLAFCAIIGWLLLTPKDYRTLGQSIVAAALSASNILFWIKSGYFVAPLEEQPLLHTWSLGVEEQFYLLFPLFLILVHRFLPRWRNAITATVCVLSFGLNVFTVRHHPGTAFYLAPHRIWELLIGALLAMEMIAPPPSTRWSNAAGVAGLGMIGVAIVVFSKSTVFPGFAALLPTIGAAAIIWAGIGKRGCATQLLSSNAPVFVGKISYSLYLWHYPLLAFGAYFAIAELGFIPRMGLVALSAILAIGSYYFVEQPVRQGKSAFGRREFVFASAGAGLVLLLSIGLALNFSGGFPSRIPRADLEVLAGAYDFNPDREECLQSNPIEAAGRPFCRIGAPEGAPTFALWGDSIAEGVKGTIGNIAKKSGEAGLFFGSSNCLPMLGIERLDVPQCGVINEAIVRYLISRPSIHTVILGGRWGFWAEGTPYKTEGGGDALVVLPNGRADNHAALAVGLEKAIAALASAHKQIWLVGPVPEVGYNVPRSLYLDTLSARDPVDVRPTYLEFVVRQRFVMALFTKIAKKYHVGIVWPHQELCDARFCRVQSGGFPLYSDGHHLNRTGANFISPILEPIFLLSKPSLETVPAAY